MSIPKTIDFPDDPKNGWICPKCGRVYAPFVYECAPCNNVLKIESNTARTTRDFRDNCEQFNEK